MKKETVQIIIPVYNAGKTLEKCLNSVKNQDYVHWQALLINDASTDESLALLEKYAKEDERFVCITYNENKGASGARNTALSKINAPYVAFLDADDYWESDMLSVLLSQAQKNDADIVQCRFIYDFSDKKTFLPKGAFKGDVVLEGKGLKKVFIKMMTGINMNHVCIKLIKSSLLKNLYFDTTLKTAEDLEFCVRMFKNVKKYVFIDKALYHYIRSEDSITGAGLSVRTRLKCNIRVSKTMVKMLPFWEMDNLFYRLLSLSRPYVIIVSKIFRVIREKRIKA